MDTPGSNAQARSANILDERKAVLFAAAPTAFNGYPGSFSSLSSPGRATAPNVIHVALAISDAETRQHIDRILKEAALGIRAKTSADLNSAVDLGGDQSKVLEWLHGYFVKGDSRPLILISDLLKPTSESIQGFLTRECQVRFARHALGTIGIPRPSRQRLTDIDRIIEPDVTP